MADGIISGVGLADARTKSSWPARLDWAQSASGSARLPHAYEESAPAITLAPLPFFELIADLSVNTGKWMRGMSERGRGWLHMKDSERNLRRIEERLDPDLAEKIYELDCCIECGSCVAACGTARMRKDFVGAVGLNRVARFRLDPRDARADGDFYEVIGDDDGVFGCMSLLGCHDVCPKELQLEMRRKMVRMGFR